MLSLCSHTFCQSVVQRSYGREQQIGVWIFRCARSTASISLPPVLMGQYFKAVNKNKKEFVCPYCLGGIAKLWEWAANPWGAIFVLLLRKSDGGGGGDFHGATFEDNSTAVVGRWAGDKVYLVGDYDSSNLYEKAEAYRNISREVGETWNKFVELPELQLKHKTCGCCENAE